ncbi:MAG: universal stress protein [Gammaproteobacteria bacterium]|nr:universal stress protein [Gammaproteobacteria bacterium]
MTFKNILVAVDTTVDAEEVIKAAQEFAEGKKSTISVVTVVRPLADYYAHSYSLVGDSTSKQLEAQAAEHTTAWLSDLTKRYGIDTSAVNVVVGKPAAEIRRLAEELSADLIVIGTHGRHGLGLMLGSTANAVLHGTPCNVLAVKVRVEGST